jgi:N12 class adenine-specific DNA methylase
VKALTDAYNRIMNGHVVRSYDGLSPQPGRLTTGAPARLAVVRGGRMHERSVILAHDVGLGKTTTMIMGAAALKASGQVTKPFVVMQRHLARSWLDEAQLVYPTADIRLITAEMLAGDQRRRTLEWLRSNTPDLTLFTEGAFASIKMSPEYQEWYEFRELGNLRQRLLRARGAPDGALAVRRLEQRLATVEARLRRNAAPMRTPGALYWEDLGFDYALIDEAHRFLGVGFRAKEAGGDTAKIRAVDLHQKLTHLHQVAGEHGGRPTVTLASGTPLRNSIFDQYKVLALAAPWVLEAFGVGGRTCGRRPSGRPSSGSRWRGRVGPKVVERFSRFISKSAMKTMWVWSPTPRPPTRSASPDPGWPAAAPNCAWSTPPQTRRPGSFGWWPVARPSTPGRSLGTRTTCWPWPTRAAPSPATPGWSTPPPRPGPSWTPSPTGSPPATTPPRTARTRCPTSIPPRTRHRAGS